METTFELPLGAIIDRVEWTNEGNRVRLFYHIPEPPKPVGVIARPWMRIKAPYGPATVLTVDEYNARVGMNHTSTTWRGRGAVPYICDDGVVCWDVFSSLATPNGEPITGYEDK